MTVEWDVTKRVSAVVWVPDDSTPKERQEVAARTIEIYMAGGSKVPDGSKVIRGTTIWSTPDRQFGG